MHNGWALGRRNGSAHGDAQWLGAGWKERKRARGCTMAGRWVAGTEARTGMHNGWALGSRNGSAHGDAQWLCAGGAGVLERIHAPSTVPLPRPLPVADPPPAAGSAAVIHSAEGCGNTVSPPSSTSLRYMRIVASPHPRTHPPTRSARCRHFVTLRLIATASCLLIVGSHSTSRRWTIGGLWFRG